MKRKMITLAGLVSVVTSLASSHGQNQDLKISEENDMTYEQSETLETIESEDFFTPEKFFQQHKIENKSRQILNDLRYFSLLEKIEEIEYGDNRINLTYRNCIDKLKLLQEPAALAREDYDYLITQQRINETESSGDPHIFLGTSSYNALQEKLKRLAYKNSVSQEEFDQAYQSFIEMQKEEAGDPGILLN